jgi:dTDP-4-amino-4,6-dideoxygalactose transaminase
MGHTISAEDIERKISDKTKAIICVHLHGDVCDMDAIMAVANKHGLKVVEDCAQAHGATYKGKKVGTIGHMGAFSFCQSKTFTTGGEGGCVVTDDEDAAWICRSFRDHGYDVAHRLRLLELEQKLDYVHNMVGFNFRMTEMQSAIGLKELERLDNWNLKNRRRNGEMLIDMLKDVPQIIRLPIHEPERLNGFWMFPVVVDIDQLTTDIKGLRTAIDAEGVPICGVQWPQSYKEKAYREHRGFGGSKFPFDYPGVRPEAVDYEKTYCPNAAWVEQRCFFVPVHPTYEPKHIEMLGNAIKKVIAAYAKE